jgi:hypothetical protein
LGWLVEVVVINSKNDDKYVDLTLATLEEGRREILGRN